MSTTATQVREVIAATVDDTDADRLANALLAAPEIADLYSPAAVMRLAARAHQLHSQLRAVTGEWASLQIDYRQLLAERA
ncbi:hypothetical protein [Nocardia sp. 852002-51244_SCH5132740]|uniref:hypothetical protein n=1 Tax=Nocardia sp. 852002-51244_SCH5132740 TaxID=1834099 RepID=UPI0007E967E0|nr:hypothetical protein [Nocardia sp. 852002-51244_SCH5132740]OBB45797.1 hypothetical protein A5748_25300 [Nocardia sp. 852002-51244_SCH5132740]